MTFVKDFDGWNEYKKNLEQQKPVTYESSSKKYFHKPGEVWFCSIGINLGVEYCGKNQHYERPILILKKIGRRIICIPLTSRKPPNSNFYIDLSYRIKGKAIESYALIYEVKTIDAVRLQRRLKRISDKKLNHVKEKIRKNIYTKPHTNLDEDSSITDYYGV